MNNIKYILIITFIYLSINNSIYAQVINGKFVPFYENQTNDKEFNLITDSCFKEYIKDQDYFFFSNITYTTLIIKEKDFFKIVKVEIKNWEKCLFDLKIESISSNNEELSILFDEIECFTSGVDLLVNHSDRGYFPLYMKLHSSSNNINIRYLGAFYEYSDGYPFSDTFTINLILKIVKYL